MQPLKYCEDRRIIEMDLLKELYSSFEKSRAMAHDPKVVNTLDIVLKSIQSKIDLREKVIWQEMGKTMEIYFQNHLSLMGSDEQP